MISAVYQVNFARDLSLLIHKVVFHGNRSMAKNKKEKSRKRLFAEGNMKGLMLQGM
jgi:hypothetical protein